ncbi:MAG: transcriptional repressor [Candidatus Abyssubacteria bacterium]
MGSRKSLKMTRQREVILQEVRKVRSHPAADEVYGMVRQRLPHISLGTVYRNLELLSEHGLIRKLEYGSAQRRYDGNAADHYHVRCVHCGRVDDVEAPPLHHVEDRIRDTSGFEILGHRLEFTGLCPDCKEGGRGAAGRQARKKKLWITNDRN